MDKKSTQHSQTSGFFINCKVATQWVVINEQDTLPMFKLLALRCHLFICKVCRLFQQQSAGLNKALKKNEEAKKLTLSLEKKEAMSKLLNELDQ